MAYNAITPINQPNNNKNFVCNDHGWEMEDLTIKEGIAMEEGIALMREINTGKLVPATGGNAGGADFVGILNQAVRTTDADYATAGKKKSVKIPVSIRATAEFVVTAGTLTAAMVGTTVAIGTTSKGLNVGTKALGATIELVIAVTAGAEVGRGICSFNMPKTLTA